MTPESLTREQNNLELIAPEGFTDGKLNATGHVQAALNALPVNIAGMDQLEECWLEWRQDRPPVLQKATKEWLDIGLQIARSQVELLARALTKALVDQRAQTAQAGFYQDYCRMTQEGRAMRQFLLEHFPNEIAQAEAGNRRLPDVMREIMMRAK
jgi:hypothetical protein